MKRYDYVKLKKSDRFVRFEAKSSMCIKLYSSIKYALSSLRRQRKDTLFGLITIMLVVFMTIICSVLKRNSMSLFYVISK